jgi:hypothetical protein
MCACVHRNECSYVYKYLHLYCVSKKIEDVVLQMIQRVGAHRDQAEACKATIQSCRAKPGQGVVLCDYSVLKSTKLSEIIWCPEFLLYELIPIHWCCFSVASKILICIHAVNCPPVFLHPKRVLLNKMICCFVQIPLYFGMRKLFKCITTGNRPIYMWVMTRW